MVVPCRNAGDHLTTLFDVLAAERPGGRWEVLVADNGSSDDTRQVAEGWADRLPVRTIDASDRRGAWHARNVGAAAARGDVLLFLDSDDIVSPGYLSAMRTALQEAELAAARLDSHSLNEQWAADSRPDTEVGGLLDHFGFLPYAASCALGIRRATFERLGGFAPMLFGEDVDFCWRAQLAGLTITPVPEAIVQYRFRTDLGGQFAQARGYGIGQANLYRRYRDAGMPRPEWRQVARRWRGILWQLIHARSRQELAAALFLVGVYLGRLEGSLRHRVVYL